MCRAAPNEPLSPDEERELFEELLVMDIVGDWVIGHIGALGFF